jgi:hypothetical protein
VIAIPAGIVVNWPVPVGIVWGLALVLAGALAMLYLDGPAATIDVTPTALVVSNPYRRYVVPRLLISEVTGVFVPELGLRDGTTVTLVAFAPAIVGANYRRHTSYRRSVVRLAKAMDEIPEKPSQAGLAKRLRFGNLVLACAAVAAALGGCALTLASM